MRLIAATFLTLTLLTATAGELRPPSKGLDGGKGGHWGEKNDSHWVDGRWNQTDVGPFMTCTLPLPGENVNSAINLRFNGDIKGGACFDATACGLRAAWTGGFLAFSGKRYGVIENPKPNGELFFTVPPGDLWNGVKMEYRSLLSRFGTVKFNYRATGAQVSDCSTLTTFKGKTIFIRHLMVQNQEVELRHAVLQRAGLKSEEDLLTAADEKPFSLLLHATRTAASFVKTESDAWHIRIPPSKEGSLVTLVYAAADADWLRANAKDAVAQFKWLFAESVIDDSEFSVPATETLASKAIEAQGLAFDDIPLPLDNPYKALFFCTGLDFFPDGTAAICTLHGDVWLVRGVTHKEGVSSAPIKWTRFATGLYQPLGLKIVNNKIYVIGRDQITLLNDPPGQPRAHSYIAFNRNPHISLGTHDYVACLDTDRAGNFYFVGPKGLHRVSKNGEKHEIVATGWRNPIAMSIGPNDEILVAPQEGEWTPASMLYVAKPGGYYGYPGPKITESRPLGYDAPLCYIPRLMDNSSGGQAWLSGEKWGALKGLPLNLSFGRSAMQFIHMDGANGALVPVNYRFPSGICRGAINPIDGHLYVVGTQGWATNAALDGCFVRVRRTEKPLLFPVGVKTFATGVQLNFENELNKEDAEDPGSYQVEAWNYKYAAKYGSEEFSVAQPDKKGHDEWTVKSAKLSADQKSVFLEIEEFQPAQQIQIQGRLNLKSGERIALDTALTVRELPAQKAP